MLIADDILDKSRIYKVEMDEIIRQWNKERKDCQNCRIIHQFVIESISKCTIKIQNH